MNDSVKRVIRTFVIAFVAIWIPGLLGWLNALTSWAKDEGATPFPDAHGLLYLGVSAIVAAVIACLNLILNLVEDYTGHGFLRTPEPKPDNNAAGYVKAPGWVVLLVAAVAIVVIALLIT